MSSRVAPNISEQFDRLPPHSIEAEMSLLASMILDGGASDIALNALAGGGRECFYQPDHQMIFDVIKRLHEQKKPIDILILIEELRKRQLYDEIGGKDYLSRILGSVPSAAHAEHYAGIVREKWMLRGIISSANDALRNAYAPHNEAQDVLNRSMASFAKLSGTGSRILTINDAVTAAYEGIEARSNGTGGGLIQTGWRDFERTASGSMGTKAADDSKGGEAK